MRIAKAVGYRDERIRDMDLEEYMPQGDDCGQEGEGERK